jgi:cytochrome c551
MQNGSKNFMKKIIYTTFLLSWGIILYSSCQDRTFTQGKDTYQRMCSNCHGQNGEGLGALIPPLAGSDYLKNNKNNLACIIKYGINKEIVVNGKSYNQAMPAINPYNTSADITNICNYISTAWGNNYGEMTLSEVEEQLKGCK